MKMYKLLDELYDDYHNNYYTRPFNTLGAFAQNIFNAIYYRLVKSSEKVK